MPQYCKLARAGYLLHVEDKSGGILVTETSRISPDGQSSPLPADRAGWDPFENYYSERSSAYRAGLPLEFVRDARTFERMLSPHPKRHHVLC